MTDHGNVPEGHTSASSCVNNWEHTRGSASSGVSAVNTGSSPSQLPAEICTSLQDIETAEEEEDFNLAVALSLSLQATSATMLTETARHRPDTVDLRSFKRSEDRFRCVRKCSSVEPVENSKVTISSEVPGSVRNKRQRLARMETGSSEDQAAVDQRPSYYQPLAAEDEARWARVHDESYYPKGKRVPPYPKNLTVTQKNSLSWARRFLFSALIGEEEPLEKDPDTPHMRGFTTSKLAEVLKAVNISASPQEVEAMMQYWNHKTPHMHERLPSEQHHTDLCKECWIKEEEECERKKLEKRLHSAAKKPSPPDRLREFTCDWEQFCWIFDACQLTAEKNGHVW